MPSYPEGSAEAVCFCSTGGTGFFFFAADGGEWGTPSMKAVRCGVVYITPLLASSKSVDVSDFQPSSPLASCHTTGYLLRTSAWSICCGNKLQALACKKRASLASGDHAGLGLEAVGFRSRSSDLPSLHLPLSPSHELLPNSKPPLASTATV